jgi:hypothetical protein
MATGTKPKLERVLPSTDTVKDKIPTPSGMVLKVLTDKAITLSESNSVVKQLRPKENSTIRLVERVLKAYPKSNT